MGLTTEDYNEILNGYNARQLENARILSEKRKEVNEHVPGYKEMEEQIASMNVKRTMALIHGNNKEAEELAEKIEDLVRDEKLALTSAGYSIHYLTPTYTCEECKDTGFVDGVRCKCFQKALMDRLFEQSNLGDVIERENFSALRHDLQTGEDAKRFEKAVSKARAFVEEFGETYRNLCFSGTVGTGKSFLSNCILGELIKKGYSCIYFSAPTLFSTIGDYKFRKNNMIVRNPAEILYSCDLLVIDDLGTEITNSFCVSELLTLLNERNLASKSTVISTNLSLEELNARYSDRVFSRLFSNFEFCPLSGQDVRIYIKQMQTRK